MGLRKGGGESSSTGDDSVDARLNRVDSELEKLHSLYQEYFSGILRIEPQKELKTFKSLMSSIRPAELKTTAQRFRQQGLQAKFTQYRSLWSKVLRQIEEGTYRRDLFLLERKKQSKQSDSKSKTVPAQPDSGESKVYESLYEKMKSLVKDPTKLPSKDKFVAALQKQIAAQKQKNPNQKVEIKLQRDSSGAVQLKLSARKDK